MTRRAADGLDGFLELVRERVAQSQVAHFDETAAQTGRGHRTTVPDQRGWCWAEQVCDALLELKP